MHVWRLLIETAGKLHHLVLAAPDHHQAWRLALGEIGAADGTLEELENTGHPHRGGPGLLFRLPTRTGAPNKPAGVLCPPARRNRARRRP